MSSPNGGQRRVKRPVGRRRAHRPPRDFNTSPSPGPQPSIEAPTPLRPWRAGGLTEDRLRGRGISLLRRHPGLRDVLFVVAEQRVLIE